MIIAPINAETIAIKTARPSPRKPKFRFNGKSKLNCNGEPDMDWGSATKDKITEVLTRIKAVIFRAFLDTDVRSGRTKAPAIGTNTIKDKISLAFMYYQINLFLRCIVGTSCKKKRDNILSNCKTLTKFKRNT